MSGIALQLWDCCFRDLQTILRDKSIGTESTEPDILAKMMEVTVKTQNVLFNVNNFLRTRQRVGARA